MTDPLATARGAIEREIQRCSGTTPISSARANSMVPAMSVRPASRPTVGALIELLLPLLVLALCFYPVHRMLLARGMKSRWSATLIGTLLTALILIPTAIAAISAASSIPRMIAGLQTGKEQIRPPPEALHSIPMVGGKLYAAWAQAS